MTRWARAGNTQKHKKMPEDPTPWEEFVEQRKAVAKNEKKFLTNKVKKISDEAASTSLKKKIKHKLKERKVKGKHHEDSLLMENNIDEISVASKADLCFNELDSPNSGDDFERSQKSEASITKKKKRKISDLPAQEGEINSLPAGKKLKSAGEKVNVAVSKNDTNEFCTEQTNLNDLTKNKNCKKKKKKHQEKFEGESLSSQPSFDNEIDCNIESDSSNKEVKHSVSSPPIGSRKSCIKKNRKTFFEKVEENREKNGIILLPRVVENRLYRMKKGLRAKGFSGEQIKRMVRDARRKAELNNRRFTQKNFKTCFNCREIGHIFADCPKVVQDNEQGCGICFKCGSTEHVSARCHIKTSDFPFAKCFICHNTGHLSRNCPENMHGIYPKGGKCNLCDSVYHLRKDCPKSSREKSDAEADITVHTIDKLGSVDDEIVEMETKVVKQRKAKIVKF